MDDNSQKHSQVLSTNRYEIHSGGDQHPCAGCQNLGCDSIHGSIRQKCVLKDCYICPRLAKIDDEISSVYQRLSDLVKERQQLMAKPCLRTIIHRMPVEIISMIFVFIKEAIFDSKLDFKFEELDMDDLVPEPTYEQPPQSPPLFVGAICKKWRDITLATPQLRTDVIVDLNKYGQSDMVNTWARRSGARNSIAGSQIVCS